MNTKSRTFGKAFGKAMHCFWTGLLDKHLIDACLQFRQTYKNANLVVKKSSFDAGLTDYEACQPPTILSEERERRTNVLFTRHWEYLLAIPSYISQYASYIKKIKKPPEAKQTIFMMKLNLLPQKSPQRSPNLWLSGFCDVFRGRCCA